MMRNKILQSFLIETAIQADSIAYTKAFCQVGWWKETTLAYVV